MRLSSHANLAIIISLVWFFVFWLSGNGLAPLVPVAVFTIVFWLAGDPLWNRIVEPRENWDTELQKLLATQP